MSLIKTLLFSIVLLVTSSITFAHGIIGNGGGGLKSANGNYILFDQNTSVDNNYPPLKPGQKFSDSKLVKDISMLYTFLPSELPNHLIYLTIERNRNYIPVTQDFVEGSLQPEIKRLQQIYEKATGFEASKIEIYAITEKDSSNTYLLPNFFKLSNLDQRIIFIHETIWLSDQIYNSNLSPENEVESYKLMLNIEKKFKTYLLETGQLQNQINLSDALDKFYYLHSNRNKHSFLLHTSAFADRQNNSVLKFSENDHTRLVDFLGNEFFNCIKTLPFELCLPLAQSYLTNHQKQLKTKSYLLTAILNSLSDFRFVDANRQRIDLQTTNINWEDLTFQSRFFSSSFYKALDSEAIFYTNNIQEPLLYFLFD